MSTDHRQTQDVLEARRTEEQEKVYEWRRDLLEKCGYPPRLAEKLADDPEVDLHRALDLVAKGCDPCVAGDILL